MKVLEDYPHARCELEGKAVEVLKKDQERKKSLCPGATAADASKFKVIEMLLFLQDNSFQSQTTINYNL